MLPACRRHDLGVIVWAPLNGGWLTGKYQGALDDVASRALRQPDHFDHGKEAIRQQKQGKVDELITVAKGAGLTLKQLALGFVLDDPAIATAIIGPRTLKQLDDLIATAALPGGLALPDGVRARDQRHHRARPERETRPTAG